MSFNRNDCSSTNRPVDTHALIHWEVNSLPCGECSPILDSVTDHGKAECENLNFNSDPFTKQLQDLKKELMFLVLNFSKHKMKRWNGKILKLPHKLKILMQNIIYRFLLFTQTWYSLNLIRGLKFKYIWIHIKFIWDGLKHSILGATEDIFFICSK